MSSSSRAFARAAACALLVCASSHAQERSAADVAAAKAQFAEALDFRAKGDLEGALKRFRAAYTFVPTPITGLEVGRTLVAMGKIAEGRAMLIQASELPKKPNESDKAQEARTEAASLAAEAQARLATLTVRTDFSADPAIEIDAAPLPRQSASTAQLLEPGHHVVVVRARGREGRGEVDLREGERREIQIDLPPEQHARTRLRPHALVWIGAGVAGVAVLTGAITGIAAFATASTVKAECPGGLCMPRAHGDLNTSLALGTTATVAFIVAGVGAAAGAVGLLISPRVPVGDAAFRLEVGPQRLWIQGVF